MNYAAQHKVWIGDMQLPVAPADITITYENQNQKIYLANSHVASFLKPEGPVTISFDFEIPCVERPYVNNEVLRPMKDYTDYFWTVRESCKPVQYIVIREKGHTDNLKVSIEDWSFTESAENANDTVISITLQTYHHWNNLREDVNLNHGLVNAKLVQGWRNV